MIDEVAMSVECGKCDAEGWHDRLKSDGELYRKNVDDIKVWQLRLGFEPMMIGKCRRCTDAITIRASIYNAAGAP